MTIQLFHIWLDRSRIFNILFNNNQFGFAQKLAQKPLDLIAPIRIFYIKKARKKHVHI